MKKNLMAGLLLAFSAAAITSCNKDDDAQNDRYIISANGSGRQEVPQVITNGTSSVTGSYRTGGRLLTYTVNWTGLSANAMMMHFHGPALPAANAAVMIPITGFTQAPSGSVSGVDTLSVDEEKALLEGKMYYNVHTIINPGGEVRAQLGVTKD
jgi:hypothetical protein